MGFKSEEYCTLLNRQTRGPAARIQDFLVLGIHAKFYVSPWSGSILAAGLPCCSRLQIQV